MKFLTYTTIAALAITSFGTLANPGSEHASEASKHSVLAAGHGLASTAQVASAVVAVPLIAVGSVGIASAAVGSELLNASVKHNHSHKIKRKTKKQELEISEVTVTVTRSPAQAMKETQKH